MSKMDTLGTNAEKWLCRGRWSPRAPAAHLNAQRISTVRGQGVCRQHRISASCSASEKNPPRARGRERKHPCFFLDSLPNTSIPKAYGGQSWSNSGSNCRQFQTPFADTICTGFCVCPVLNQRPLLGEERKTSAHAECFSV
jgi:hypothetical protein